MKLFPLVFFSSMLIQCTPSQKADSSSNQSQASAIASQQSPFQLTADECTQLSGDSTCSNLSLSYTPGSQVQLHNTTETHCKDVLHGTWISPGDCSFTLDKFSRHSLKCVNTVDATDKKPCYITVTVEKNDTDTNTDTNTENSYEIQINHLLAMNQAFSYKACNGITGKVENTLTLDSDAIQYVDASKIKCSGATITDPDTEVLSFPKDFGSPPIKKLDDGTFRLTNNFLGMGRCLDTYSGSNNRAFMEDCASNTSGTFWHLIPVPKGNGFRLSNMFLPNKCLDINISASSNFIFMEDCAKNTAGSVWEQTPTKTGSFQLINTSTSKCLDTDSDSGSQNSAFLNDCANNTPGSFWLKISNKGGVLPQ